VKAETLFLDVTDNTIYWTKKTIIVKEVNLQEVDIKIEKVHKTKMSQSEAKQVSKWYFVSMQKTQ
jgi:hypothetical protein